MRRHVRGARRASRLVLTAVLALSASMTVLPREADAAQRATVGPFTFEIGPYQLKSIPEDRLPYNATTLVASCGLTDGSGVAIYRAADGSLYDHPVGQARCALNMLRNFRIDPDPAYLDQSIANARRLLARAVSHSGAIFFPYPFSHVNPGRSTMRPPWYSAMAQGQALSVFVRLYEITGDPAWSRAATSTFASFKVPRSAGGPWVAAVDQGRLWLDEYPTVPLDRVWNGHNFATFGLYDYWRLTGSQEARLLILGAMHSSYVAAYTRGRVPGAISQYCVSDACLAAQVRNPGYHVLHIGQLQTLTDLTGHWHFASLAEAFQLDSPRTNGGTAMLGAGTHDAYQFDEAGNGTRKATVSLSAPTPMAYNRREVPGGRYGPGNGIWLRIGSGELGGLWVRESARAWPMGAVDSLTFIHGRSVQVAGGTFAGSTYAADGAVVETVSIATEPAAWSYVEYARINGRPSVRLASGPLSGRWLTLDSRTLRDSTPFADIDPSIFRTDIIWLDAQQITRGCAAFRYCPAGLVTREQMASFLVRALRLPSTSVDFFDDDDRRTTESDINRLAAAGIAAGCAADRFCPTRSVRRSEMASFLVRALDLPPSSVDLFDDDDSSPHENDINRLAAAGITAGCAADRFCPNDAVSRGQMAAFLRRALIRFSATGTAGVTTSPGDSSRSTPSPDPSPSPTVAPEPTPSPSPSPSPSPTMAPEPTATPEPSATPSASASSSDPAEPTPIPATPAPDP